VIFGTVEKSIDIKLKILAVMMIFGIYIEEICWYKVSQVDLVICAAIYAGLEEL
jgi:hypothetical protein